MCNFYCKISSQDLNRWNQRVTAFVYLIPTHQQCHEDAYLSKYSHTQKKLNFIFAKVISKKWYLSIFLIYITLIVSTVGHIFTCLEVIYISFSIDPKVSTI